jgi:hypothetical protein
MKPPQAPDPLRHQLPANPRSPNHALLMIASVALAIWTIVLLLIALQVV